MTSKIEADRRRFAQGEFTSPEHFNLSGAPNAWTNAFGNIPTNEELMIALDTAALAK